MSNNGKEFVHLHNHSEFSLLDGLSHTADMAKRAKELGHSAIALTDHGTAAGLTSFYQACKNEGIKPILGIEAYITPMGHSRFEREQYDVKELRGKPGHQSNRYHLILLAKDLQGYHNLCALTTASFSEGYYYKPRIDMELLREHSEGLICSSACILGEVQHHLFCHDYEKAKEVALAYQDIFGDDFYMEIMNHGLDMEIQVMRDIRKLAKEIGAKVIATNDTHFVYAKDHKLQKTLMLLGMHKSWADDDVDGFFFDEDDNRTDNEYEDESGESDPIFSMPAALYIKDYDEMLEVLRIEGGEDGVAEQELANTLEIAEKCNCELPLIDPTDMSAYHTPIYNIPGDEQYDDYIKEPYEIPQIVADAVVAEMKDDGREGEKIEDFLNEHELESTRFLCWMCEKGIRELVRPKIEAKGNPLPTEFWCENPPEGFKITHAHNSPDELWIKEQLANGLSEDDIIQLYYKRFSEEMAVVLRKGFCDYFLIVQSYVNYSRFAGATVGPGRGCLTGDSLVWTTCGYKRLDEIGVGDLVIGASGQVKPVVKTHKYECDEELVRVHSFYGGSPITMTPDHEVLVIKQEQEENARRRQQGYVWKQEVTNTPQWIPAQQIEAGDFVVFPRSARLFDYLEQSAPKTFDLAQYIDEYKRQNPGKVLDVEIHDDYIVEHRCHNQKTANHVTKRMIARESGVSRHSLAYILNYVNEHGDVSEIINKQGRRATRSTRAMHALLNTLETHGFHSISEWNQYLDEHKTNDITYKRFIENDAKFCFALGAMVSDGCVRARGIELNIAEQRSKSTGEILQLFKQVFGVELSPIYHNTKDLVQWTLSSKLHTYFWSTVLPGYEFTAQTKRLPEWIYVLSTKQKTALLRGAWWGDGSTSGKWKYTTVSQDLAFQLRNLMWSIGTPCSMKKHIRFDERAEFYGEHVEYSLTCPKEFGHGRLMNSYVDDDYIMMRVNEIEAVPPSDYDGCVYDITVQDDHSYMTDSFLVHNSGAGALLNYLIGITAVDPLPNGLLFSRFLAPKRLGYPDIDCDFSKEFRDNELKPYLKKVYGDDCASAVATLMMYWGKAAIKAAGRVLFNPPISVDYANDLCALVDDAPKLDLNTQLEKNEDGTWVNPAFVEKANSTKEHKQILDLALQLQGHVSGESIHASAYILSPHPITDKLPLSVSKDERKRAQETGEPIDNYIIQYDGECVQSNWGYVKLDLLAIVDLAMADHAMKTIERVYGCKINIENIPLDDKATFDLLLEGYNSGIFQFDGSPVAIRILTASGANSISDWASINALNRPGPLQMGYDVEFINGKKHPDQITFFAPTAEKILRETYGATCVTGDTMVYCENGDLIPIIDIKPGMKVLSDDGDYHIVSNWFDQGIRETVTVCCKSGEKLVCTADHRVLTDNGWAEASTLKAGFRIKAFDSDARPYYAEVSSISLGTSEHVYDIQVEDTHNFCGNGLILHNCFQEQLMLLSQDPAIVGFDETEADHLRKVTAKKKKDQLAALRVEIEERAKENGVAPEIYETFADIAIAAGSYSFNKSHALAYAIIAYRNAFLKTHFPECFLASMCTFKPMQKKKNKIPGYLEEARQFGLTVKPPHVNYSMEDFDVPERGVIAFGLGGIKKVGKAAAPIITEREANGPFKDFTDFCVRVPRTVGKQPLEALIKAGALDNLGWTRMAMEESIDQIVQFRKDYFADKEKKEKFSDDLFGGFFASDTFDAEAAANASAPAVELVAPFDTEYSEKQLMRKEKENFEMYLSRDPRDFSRVSRYITECEMEDEASRPENKASLGYKHPLPINISQVPDLDDKILVQFVANVTDCRQFYTKKGDPMASMFVWDNGADEASRFGFSPSKSTLKCTIFPKTWKNCIRPMPDDVVHVTGRISRDPEGRYADAVLVDTIEVIPEDSSWTNKSTPMEKVYEFKAAMDAMLERDEALGDPASDRFLIPAITFKNTEDLEAFKNDPELEDRFHDPRGHVQVMVEGDDSTSETLNLKQTVGLVKFALREYHGIAKKVRWDKAQRALDRRRLLMTDDNTVPDSIAAQPQQAQHLQKASQAG